MKKRPFSWSWNISLLLLAITQVIGDRQDRHLEEHKDHPKFRRTQKQGGSRVVEDEYIVVFRKDIDSKKTGDLGKSLLNTFADSSSVKRSFNNALKGFSAKLSTYALVALLNDDRVAYVQEVS
jgi:hypothetical protein